jgi:type II secretory pathway component PulF
MASGRDATNPIARVLRAAGWCLIAVGVLGSFIGLWTPLGLFLSLPLGAMLLFAIANYGKRRCEALQDTLLGLITLATRHGIPLGPLAEAFARDAPTWAVRPATSFACKLHEGHDLAAAARGTIGLLPRRATMAIRVGQQLDELAPCLDLYIQANRQAREADHRLSNIMGYMLIVMMTTIAAGSIQAFLAWRIMPGFQLIFADFSMPVPRVTEAFAKTLDYAYLYYIPVLAASLLLAALVGFVWMLHLASSLGWIPVSLLGPLRIGSDAAMVLRLLGVAIGRDRSVQNALMALSESHPQRHMRRRLRGAALDVRLGLNSWTSLAKYRLVRPCDVPLLDAAQRAGNLPWALGELAARNARRTNQRTMLVLRTLTAVCFVLVAAQVLFYAVAGFTPIVTLIESLA